MRRKKRNKIFLLIILILVISIGFAFLSTTLKINGTANIGNNTWKVYWDNVNDEQKSDGTTIETNGGAKVDTTDPTLVSFNVTLNSPGDFYEFQVDAVNAGTIDAMVGVITKVVDGDEENELPDYLVYKLTYADDSKVLENDLLPKAVNLNTTPKQYSSVRYKFRLEFSKDLDEDDLAEIANNNSHTIQVKIPYIQATSAAQPKGETPNIPTDPWNKIVNAYKHGITGPIEEAMNNGTTKEVELDLDHDGTAETTAHLRIVNVSSPNIICNNESYSQTACGLVVEFVEGIEKHIYNPWPAGSTAEVGEGTKGGWKYSDMRAYLNGSKTPNGRFAELDYTDEGFIDALPSDLSDLIISTRVVSGHGPSDSDNITTTDKLFLFATHEIWKDQYEDGIAGIDANDTSYYNTRQLDYYNNRNVTVSNNTANTKKNNLSNEGCKYFLRSPVGNNNAMVYDVLSSDGTFGDTSVNDPNAYISPAFRLAE